MYIAFMLILSDLKKVNLKYFHHMVNSLRSCKNDNNIVHIFISSNYNLHHLDHHLKQFKLFHIKTSKNNDIDKRHECYHNLIMTSEFEYHWIINVRPDLLIFDTNMFYNIRQKFDVNYIHARARYYVGPKTLNKNEKSYWNVDDTESYKHNKNKNLIILDNNIFFVPQGLSYRVFKNTINTNTNQNNHFKTIPDTSTEKTQSLIWYNENIPLNIIYLVFVPPEDMLAYNIIES